MAPLLLPTSPGWLLGTTSWRLTPLSPHRPTAPPGWVVPHPPFPQVSRAPPPRWARSPTPPPRRGATLPFCWPAPPLHPRPLRWRGQGGRKTRADGEHAHSSANAPSKDPHGAPADSTHNEIRYEALPAASPGLTPSLYSAERCDLPLAKGELTRPQIASAPPPHHTSEGCAGGVRKEKNRVKPNPPFKGRVPSLFAFGVNSTSQTATTNNTSCAGASPAATTAPPASSGA